MEKLFNDAILHWEMRQIADYLDVLNIINMKKGKDDCVGREKIK